MSRLPHILFILTILFPPASLHAARNTRIDLQREGDYHVTMIPPLKVHSSLKRSETKKIGRYLQLFLDEADTIFPRFLSPEDQVAVYLLASRKEYFRFVQENDAPTAKYAGGYFSHTANQVVVWSSGQREEMIRTLFHELTHYYSSRNFKLLPQAINEGLSTYLQTVDLSFHKLEFGNTNSLYIENYRKHLSQDSYLPLSSFLALQGYDLGRMHEQFGAPQYARAWALTWYGLNGPPEVRGRFQEYLQAMTKHGDASGDKFMKIVALNGTQFEKEIVGFLGNRLAVKKARRRTRPSLARQ